MYEPRQEIWLNTPKGKGNLGKPKTQEHKDKISKASKEAWKKRRAGMAELVDAVGLGPTE